MFFIQKGRSGNGLPTFIEVVMINNVAIYKYPDKNNQDKYGKLFYKDAQELEKRLIKRHPKAVVLKTFKVR